ncbi:MAG TPA: EAL domain-containing protein [Chromatiales bacterium]|nr:EAL domain-containing protein [Thiotrichales bacterium]HIP67274.1 EAL domain-containing protein [Chromatiales bacterium]
MQHLLLVEKSKTQRIVLERLLLDAGYTVSVLADRDEALALLASDEASRFSTVVLGNSEQGAASVRTLKAVFDTNMLASMPLILLINNPDLQLQAWVKNRHHTSHFRYADQDAILQALQNLFFAETMEISAAMVSIALTENTEKITVLLVDDSKSTRRKYSQLLESSDYEVITAGSAQSAWDIVEQEAVDLVIMDYFMPDMEGNDLCRKFKQDPRFLHLPCVIMTGSYLDETIKKSIESGAVEVMFKSEPEALFLARVDSLASQIRLKKYAQSERYRYEAILTSIGDGVYGVDSRGQINYMNPAGRKLLGIGHESEYMGQAAQVLIHQALQPQPGKTTKDVLSSAYEQGHVLEKHETLFRHKNGSQLQVECTVYPLQSNSGVQGSVVAFRNISERKRLERQLYWHATHDPLTTLHNRLRFEKALSFEVERLKGLKDFKESAMLFIDLDRFKYLNDTAGHEAGDKLLVDVSQRLKRSVRKGDTLARLGGDEFAVILRNVDSDQAYKISESLRKVMEECTFVNEEISFKLSCTIGITLINKNMSPKEAMVNADIACNTAKQKGKRQSYLFDATKDVDKAKLTEEIGWSTRLNDALKNDRFKLFYQPILPLSEINFELLPDHASKLWTGLSHLPEHYEVLLRMRGDDGGYISPYAFLNIAERFNLMPAIDSWVVQNAIARLQELQQEDERDISFSINLSGTTLNDVDMLQNIREMLESSGIKPGSILFEITETNAIEQIDQARSFIETMRMKGWRFALDDFGTGFSSFSQLKDLPVDVVKIDGSFVQNMARDPIDRAIVMAINDIAHSLGMETIAEYVEDAEILRLLNLCGVDHAQGYYIAKPLMDVETRADNTVMLRLVEPITGA